AHLTTPQKLLLLGDGSAPNETDRWKPLWQSDPGNPAYFMEYAMAYCRDHNKLSPEILETAARIDADNAWYPAIEAAAKAKTALKKKSPDYYARQRGEKTTYSVIDEAAFANALELFRQAAAKPRLTNHQVELRSQRSPLLPKRRDLVSQFPGQTFDLSQNCGTIKLSSLAEAICIEAGRCAERKDIAGFQQLVTDWRWLVSSAARNGVSLLDLLVAKALFTIPLGHLRDAAKSLGLEADAGKFATLYQQHEDKHGRPRKRMPDSETSETAVIMETKSSVMTWLTLTPGRRQADAPPPISEADLRPGRYTDHALFGRVHALASWAILGLCAGLAALSRMRESETNNRMAGRLQDLLPWQDWVRILAGGITVPLLWFFTISRLTPLSAREWSMRITGFQQPACQLGAMTLLVLVTSAVIAAGCLVKRAGILGPKPRLPWLGWLAVISAALAIPVFGAVMAVGPLGMTAFYTGCSLAGVALLWLAWGFIRHTFRKPSGADLRRATLARIMVPTWIFGMLIFALLVPVYYAEERQWIKQEHLLEITPATNGMSRYEWDLTQVIRKELLAKLDQSAPFHL
ncbi:MAG TPA: hypothetical protein VF258_02675, partial [Luteolibacter sp.]